MEANSEVILLSPRAVPVPKKEESLQAVVREELRELEKDKCTLSSLLTQLDREKSKYNRDKSRLMVEKSILMNRTHSYAGINRLVEEGQGAESNGM